MPHYPTAPPGTRFFGRVDRFHCECPACGTIIIGHIDQTIRRGHGALKRRRGTQYNPIMSLLTCPNGQCRRIFGVGLILWSYRRGRRRSARYQIPADHRPTRRQMAALAPGYGVWAYELKDFGDDLNVALDLECSCDAGCWSPQCPVHGEAAVKAQQEALRAAEETEEIEEPEEEEEG